MAFKAPITIQKAIDEIATNSFILPAIQREFVWSTDQIEDLFDSLIKGYPIGSFLFWKIQPDRIGDFQFYRFMDHYHERDYTHNEQFSPPQSQPITAVLDGQQRLTALIIGLKGWYAYKLPRYWWSNDDAFPKRELYINLIKPDETQFGDGYNFKFLRDKDVQAKNEENYWLKIGKILEFKEINDIYQYCVREGLLNQENTYSSNTMVKLWNVLTQTPGIHYFQEEDQDLDKVLNIFIRVNSGGTPLSYSDMLLSIATAAWEEKDARQVIYELVDNINDIGDGFKFDKDFVLKSSLVLTDIQAIEFRVMNFNRENMLLFEDHWEKIANAIRMTIKLLATWGYNGQNLVSRFAAIPLAYHIYHLDIPSNFLTSSKFHRDRKNMLHWLRVALLKRTFSGPTDNTLRAIRRAMQVIKEELRFPLEEIFNELAPTAKSMKFDEPELDGILSYHYGQSYTFSVLSFLYPWLKFDQQFNIDHIFPKSLFRRSELRKRGIPEDEWYLWLEQVDILGNLQLLQGPVNMSKSDREFEDWLTGETEEPVDLIHYKEMHMIPDVDLSFENFPEFVEARTMLMRKKLAELLNVDLKTEYQTMLRHMNY
jgi:hypothetical protein